MQSVCTPNFSYEKLSNARIIAFDVESTGVHHHKDIPVGVSIAYDEKDYAYIPIDSPTMGIVEHILVDNKVKKIAHNASFDRLMMKKLGVNVDNIDCTMLMSHMVGTATFVGELQNFYGEPPAEREYIEGNIDLDLSTCSYWFNRYHVDKFHIFNLKNSSDCIGIPPDQWLTYSGPHSVAALKLYNTLLKNMIKLGLMNSYINVERPIIPVISDIEYTGVHIDTNRLKEIGEYIDKKIEILADVLNYYSDEYSMNHNSPDQVRWLLYEKFNLPKAKWFKGKSDSVDKRYLDLIKDKHPYIPIYIMYKEFMTLRNSYIRSLMRDCVDGKIYGRFNQTGTRTSRLSSSSPNLQKIPARSETGKKIRTAFVAPEGNAIIKADYDQLELRMCAVVSRDDNMCEAFNAGRDIHTETAILVFRDAKRRREGKTKNFELIYGGGGIAEQEMIYGAYPGINKWKSEFYLKCLEWGKASTRYGWTRAIRELRSNASGFLSAGRRDAVSTHIQGSSSEIVKLGMKKIWDQTHDSDIKMLLQVHDELVFSCPAEYVNDAIKTIKECMETSITLLTRKGNKEVTIPFSVSIMVGSNWGDTK